MNVVIMAGGGGSRLWPLSRQSKPKQFLDLGSGKTLLEETWERAKELADTENIFVATTQEYAQQITQLLPETKKENMMFEPERRDNGPAFAIAATILKDRGKGEEPTIFMWSDHVFTNESELLADLKKIPGILAAHPKAVVIVGHIPTFPETGLGYLEVGEKVEGHSDVYKVTAFKEKPDKKTAEEYVISGNYFWNMAYISVQPSFLLDQLKEYNPELMQRIEECRQALAQDDSKAFAKAYGQCEKISIDYALLEKTPNIIAVTGDYGWSDVGNWGAVKDIFGVEGDHMPTGHHIHVDANNNYVYNATQKVVSLVGIKDCIIVVTEDAMLVTHKDSSHKVKDVVQRLEQENRKEFL
ncbi:MAG: sugar phosphate nucleotidyltransferase [Candidatus Andersenbacteria bacterium]